MVRTPGGPKTALLGLLHDMDINSKKHDAKLKLNSFDRVILQFTQLNRGGFEKDVIFNDRWNFIFLIRSN